MMSVIPTAGLTVAASGSLLPINKYTANAAAAAGRANDVLEKNLSFIDMFIVLLAAMVVSEIIEILSPNIAPPMTAPTITAGVVCISAVILSAIGVRAAIVPQLVPIASERKQATTNIPGSSSEFGNIC